jgi:hypothetical protein
MLGTLSVLSACTGGGYTYGGYKVYDHFPLDGYRTWDYAQGDESVEWQMAVEKDPNTSETDDYEIITLNYRVDDPETNLFAIDWSSDSIKGVLIHGFVDYETGDSSDFDPPLVFGEYQMVPGAEVSTETGGRTWTSTFESVEECPNHWVTTDEDTWECLKFTLDDGDGDDLSGPPFAGSWWIAPRYGTSRFIPTGYDDAWVLTKATWTSD